MQFITTTAGQNLFQTATQPPVLTSFKLGSNFNYVPTASQNDVQGSVVFTGTPSSPIVVENNLVKYIIKLDREVGDFQFGEVGLFFGTTMVAIAAVAPRISKTAGSGGNVGNEIILDCYISTVGTSYAVYAEQGNSEGALDILQFPSIDALPNAQTAASNIAIVPSPSGQGNTLCTAFAGQWTFSNYIEVKSTGVINGTGVGTLTVTNAPDGPSYTGQYILQIISGNERGAVRSVVSIIGNLISLSSAFQQQPEVGDSYRIFAIPAFGAGSGGGGPAPDLNPLLPRDGSRAMTANLNFGTQRGINLQNPIANTDAANKGYVDSAITDAIDNLPPGGGSSNHNTLSNLQGGDSLSSEFYHMTLAEFTFVREFGSTATFEPVLIPSSESYPGIIDLLRNFPNDTITTFNGTVSSGQIVGFYRATRTSRLRTIVASCKVPVGLTPTAFRFFRNGVRMQDASSNPVPDLIFTVGDNVITINLALNEAPIGENDLIEIVVQTPVPDTVLSTVSFSMKGLSNLVSGSL
jgi:hypothetical protein